MQVDIKAAMQPKSDQLNADDLISGSMTVTIAAVKQGSAEQPIIIELAQPELHGRPYKPSKSMLRVLVSAWGDDAATWAGRSITLYRDPEVRYAGVKVGGIKISHMTHITSRLELMITVSRGKRVGHIIEPLVIQSLFDTKKNDFTAAVKAGKSQPAAIIEWLQKHEQLTKEQINYINGLMPQEQDNA